MSLRVVVDDQVERAEEAFALPGVEVIALESARIDREAVADADALIVRSTLRVDAELVKGSRLRFVGSATVGVDHVDETALRDAGIAFAAAPGSSAASVAQFTLACLVLACDRLGRDWSSSTLAVFGAGAIGERVATGAERLGLEVLRHDPPLGLEVGREHLARADAATLHVPLTRGGAWSTSGMVDRDFLARLGEGALLLNTARGPVIDGTAVRDALASGRLGGAVLDVFPHEPGYDVDLVALATLVTPHVAGRSEEALVANTAAVRAAMGRALDLDLAPWTPRFDDAGALAGDCVAAALRGAWGLERYDSELRAACDAGGRRAEVFRALRRVLPRRRDLTSFRVAADAHDTVRRFHEALPTR